MSADSEPPPTPEPEVPPPGSEATPPPAAEDTATPEYLPQKRRYKKPEPAAFDFGVPDETDDEILILGSLLQRLLARKQAESAEPETRSKINRFVQRSTAPLAAAPTGETGVADPAPAPTENGSAPPDDASTDADAGPARPMARPLPKLTPRPVTAAGDAYWSPPSRGRGVLYLVFCAGLAIAAFLVGRSAAHPGGAAPGSVAAPTPAPQWNATLLGKLDQVLAADQSGDLEKAKTAALDLKKQIGSSLELDLYLATLTTRLGHTNDAEADLSRMLEPYMQPLQAAAVNEGMAFTYSRRRDFKRAAEAFADASRINPFAPENFYRWGEVLRRQGRFQDAIDKFRQALQRLPEGDAATESQRECAAFKMGVAQIELGHDSEIKPEIDNHLRQPSPSGYWLLTAAAYALQHNDLPGAVDFLQKAREALPSEQYATLTDDYFFHGYAEKPEMSHVLSVPSAEGKQKEKDKMVYFVDP